MSMYSWSGAFFFLTVLCSLFVPAQLVWQSCDSVTPLLKHVEAPGASKALRNIHSAMGCWELRQAIPHGSGSRASDAWHILASHIARGNGPLFGQQENDKKNCLISVQRCPESRGHAIPLNLDLWSRREDENLYSGFQVLCFKGTFQQFFIRTVLVTLLCQDTVHVCITVITCMYTCVCVWVVCLRVRVCG